MSSVVPLLSAAQRSLDQADFAEAERLWRLVLARQPGHAAASRALGELLMDLFRDREAMEIVGAAARQHPLDAGLRLLMARSWIGAGNVQQALGLYESVLKRDAGSIPARVGKGACLAAMHRSLEALELLEPALRRAPLDYGVRSVAGRVHALLGRYRQAIENFEAAAKLRPAPGILGELGWAYYDQGRMAEAATAFERANAINPDISFVIAGRAAVLQDTGDREGAKGLLRSVAGKHFLNPKFVSVFARAARTREERAEVRAAIEKSLALPVPPAAKSASLFILGKLKEDDGDYDGAFECYRVGNEREGPPMDEAALGRATGELLSVYSRESLERLPRGKFDSLPVFIIGMPRSGTTLVEQILASHPEVYGAGELPDLTEMARSMPRVLGLTAGARYPDCVRSLTQAQVDAMADRYLSGLRQVSGAAVRVTDKMPQNFVCAGLIDILFPGARVLHCVRDPLDTCVSIYATPLSQGHTYKGRLSDLAIVYRDYWRMMEHWRRTLRVPMMDVRYEELVGDPEQQSRRIVEFADLSWDPACLKFYENTRIVRTASSDQVRRPMYASSIGRWKRFERHIPELIEGLKGLE